MGKINNSKHITKSGIVKNNPSKNYYVVAEDTGKLDSNGFFAFPMGTHTTYGRLKEGGNILYEGFSAVEANRAYNMSNRGYGKFEDEHRTKIYKSINGKPPKVLNHGFVIHKV